MKILHIADMTEFHIKIDSVIYRSVVEENKIDGVSSFLYSSSVTDNKNEFILGGDLNIKEFIKNEMPDLVIFHSLYKLNNLKIYPLLKSLNIKYAIRPHGSLSRAVLKKNLLKKTFFNLLFFNRFIKNASGIIFLSKGEMKQSFFRNGKNIFLPNMIDIKILESNMEKKDRIIFIGKVENYYKNMDFIIDVFEKENCNLEIYGPIDKNYENFFKNRIKKISNIHYKGEIYNKEKFELIASSKGLVLLSRSEGMPMVVLEALSLGTPCFLSVNSNMDDYIIDYETGVITELDLLIAKQKLQSFLGMINNNNSSEYCKVTCKEYFKWDAEKIISAYRKV